MVQGVCTHFIRLEEAHFIDAGGGGTAWGKRGRRRKYRPPGVTRPFQGRDAISQTRGWQIKPIVSWHGREQEVTKIKGDSSMGT